MKKLVLAAIAGSVLSLGSAVAAADTKDPFPRTFGPIDYTVPAGTSDTNSPFPKTFGPIDRSIEVAMPESNSPFPKEHMLGRAIA